MFEAYSNVDLKVGLSPATIIIHGISCRLKIRLRSTSRLTGSAVHFPRRQTLIDIVRALNLEPERVAIEFNRAIVKREFWTSTAIDEGAEIEIVQFVGGG